MTAVDAMDVEMDASGLPWLDALVLLLLDGGCWKASGMVVPATVRCALLLLYSG